MVRLLAVLVLLGGYANAQSGVDLLKNVENHYASSKSFEERGRVSGLLPGTSWKVSYGFHVEAVQPSALPFEFRSSAMLVVDKSGGNFSKERTDPKATDPFPKADITLRSFGEYNRVAHRVLNATLAGTESITVDGHTHRCEIVNVTYDASPDFRPNSKTSRHRLWVNPKEFIVLREEVSSSDGIAWTAEISMFSFNQPTSAGALKVIEDLQKKSIDRQDWNGKPLPNLTVQPLSGSAFNLADLRGKPVLLDFWGSYCLPCKGTTLHAQELAGRYKAAGLTVVSFTRDRADDAKLWAEHNHVTVPIILDREDGAFLTFMIDAIPEAILVGADGKVIHFWSRLDDLSELDSVLKQELGDPGPILAP